MTVIPLLLCLPSVCLSFAIATDRCHGCIFGLPITSFLPITSLQVYTPPNGPGLAHPPPFTTFHQGGDQVCESMLFRPAFFLLLPKKNSHPG